MTIGGANLFLLDFERLILKNITFNGDNDTQVKYAVVSPDKEEGKLYNLFIDNCKFKNFKKGES